MFCYSIRRLLFLSTLFSVFLVWLVMVLANALLNAYALRIVDLYVLIVGLPLVSLLLWSCVKISLQPLKNLSYELTHRASNQLDPLDTHALPIEIRPIVEELNQLFIELKDALQKNKQFASDAAHELKTPLAVIKLQAQVAVRANDPQELKQSLRHLIHGVDRSAHIIEQLLTLSRLDPEAKLKDMHPVNLDYLAPEIIAMLVPAAIEKNIDIEFHGDAQKTTIHANDISIGILLRNLVDNAIRYTPNGGAVNIYLLNKENTIILRVADTGPGIPDELHERVFERFFRVLGTETTGSGLGLAIVHQIACLHNARIQLSTPENKKGLQVDVIFPAVI